MAATPHSSSLAQSTDAALVQAIQCGDQPALEQLVQRYWPMVFTLLLRMMGQEADALDVAQEVFLTAQQRIGQLAQPDRLRSWLWKIARNQALAALRQRSAQPQSFNLTAAMCVFGSAAAPWAERAASPLASAEQVELAQHIRRSLATLGERHRQLIDLFYLQGLDIAAIAARLNIPAGTIKWWLSEARQELRKELIMSAVTDEIRATSDRHAIMDVSGICGQSDRKHPLAPEQVCRTLLAQQILVCVRKQAKTTAQIAREVKADVSYVEDHLARMTEAEVLAEVGDGYRANCILLDGDDIQALHQALGWRALKIADCFASVRSRLDEAIARTSPARLGFDVDELRWLVVHPMTMAMGLSRAIWRMDRPWAALPMRPDGNRWIFLPSLRDAITGRERGCNMSAGSTGWAQYWSEPLKLHLGTNPSEADLKILVSLAHGPVPLADLIKEHPQTMLASLAERGLLRIDGEEVKPTIPVFNADDAAILQPVIDSVLKMLLREMLPVSFEDVDTFLTMRGFGFARDNFPPYHDLAWEGFTQALLDKGVLTLPAKPVRKGWGLFAWTDGFSPMCGR